MKAGGAMANSGRLCKHCSQTIERRGSDPHNWYNEKGEVWCKGAKFKSLHEPEPISGEASPLRKYYAISRASLPERVDMWKRLRDSGVNIIATWIDEAGPGQTQDLSEL